MDQVEFLFVGPRIFEIFDLEDAVHRNAGIVRLDLATYEREVQVGLNGA